MKGEGSVCGFEDEDTAQTMADLLPEGVVWPRDPESTLMLTMAGLGVEFRRVYDRDCDLLAEAYPPTALETLPDWLRVCGLPDDCTGEIVGVDEQRLAIMGKLAARGGQSRAYFIELAAVLGYDISIAEFRPMLADQARVGDSCFNQSAWRGAPTDERLNDWWFVWQVRSVTAAKVEYFRAGQNYAGDPLSKWGDDVLECFLNENKPAHTQLMFAYGVDPPDPPDPPFRESIWDLGATVYVDGGIPSRWDYTP